MTSRPAALGKTSRRRRAMPWLVAMLMITAPALAQPRSPEGTSLPTLGLPALPAPAADLPIHRRRIELGRRLFFERRLSLNGTMSCAMCHVPEEAFASNASRTAVGLFGRSLVRNAPTLLNVGWQRSLFHDGRETSLERQAWLPLLHPDEMGNASEAQVLAALKRDPAWRRAFGAAFGARGIDRATVGEALAAYERSLVAAGSRFDRWRFGNESDALDAQERAGFDLFTGRAGCVRCHQIDPAGARFTDDRFHATGAGSRPPAAYTVPLAPGVATRLTENDLAAFADPPVVDTGRFEVSRDPADRFAFKTPSLRNVARTAPYMHDGSLPTLESVIAFYNDGLGAGVASVPLGLSADEQRQLGAFLRSLDGAGLDRLAADARAGLPLRLGGR